MDCLCRSRDVSRETSEPQKKIAESTFHVKQASPFQYAHTGAASAHV